MGKYTVGNFKLRVGRSRTGRGVFACEDIPKGACLAEYVGPLVSDDDASRDRGRYLFSISKKKTIDGNVPENRARYINHSCRPNCEATGPNGRVFIMARRRIKDGEELAYDYGKEYFDEFIKPKGCKCAKCEERRLNGSRAASLLAKRQAARKSPQAKRKSEAKRKSATKARTGTKGVRKSPKTPRVGRATSSAAVRKRKSRR